MVHGQFTPSDEVGCSMQSSPLGSTHCQTTKSVACHHRPWTRYTVGLRQAWHTIMDLNQHTRTAEVEQSTTSSPLDNTRDRTTSYISCLHGPWNAQTVGGCWGGMPSSPLGNTRSQTTLGVTCRLRLGHYTGRDDVGYSMTLSPIEKIHD